MARPLVVSTDQLRDEIGAVDSYSPMSLYLARSWGNDPDKQNTKIADRIREAQSDIENKCGIYFFHTRIVSLPVEADKVRGTDYDVAADAYPYASRDFTRYATIYLRRRPVVSIQSVALRYGSGGQRVAYATFPEGWIQPQTRLGVLHILPLLSMGGNNISGGSFLMLPVLGGMLPSNYTIPLLLGVDYTAGFLPLSFNPDTDDAGEISGDLDPTPLIRAVRFQAAANVLRGNKRAIAPGGGSIGMDGFSQSWSSNMFGEDIADYEGKVAQVIEDWQGNLPLPVMTLN